jgi:hypothetical protein
VRPRAEGGTFPRCRAFPVYDDGTHRARRTPAGPAAGRRVPHPLVPDRAGRRPRRPGLPIWLNGPQGHGLWQIVAPGVGPPIHEAEAQTSRLLQAADVAVTGADIDELDPAITAGPRRGRPDAGASAGIEFTSAGADEPRQMQVSLGYALALAAAFGAPVRVADQVMDSLGVATRGEDLLGVFLGEDAPRSGEPHEPDVPSFEPRNLTFADGLADWEFGGSFRDEHSHAADYACTADAGTAVLAAAVQDPEGFAALTQSVLARKYVGRTVTFRAEVRTEDVANEAGLHLLGGMPTGPISLPKSVTVPLAGSNDWTALELSAQVAEHGGMVQFGVFLRGPGRVALRNPQLSFTPAAGA